MTKLPRNIKPQRIIKLLEKLDFVRGKGRGSHVRLAHPDGRWTQIAVHPKPIPIGTLKKIVDQAKITQDQLKELI